MKDIYFRYIAALYQMSMIVLGVWGVLVLSRKSCPACELRNSDGDSHD